MKMYEPYQKKPTLVPRPKRGLFIGLGAGLIAISVLILGLAIWDIASSISGQYFALDLPGFQELKLKSPGLYAAVYQHHGNTPIPAEALSKMQVRIFSEETYENIPVMMNTTGQTFQQMGLKGMPLFNFIIQKEGRFTLSGVYPDGINGPTVSVVLMSQATQNIKGAIFAGLLFFILFLGTGIWVLVRTKHWLGHST